LLQVTHGEAGMLTAELHFAVEGEVVTHHYLGACNESGRQAFIMRVTQPTTQPNSRSFRVGSVT
jgi:hypothetical protein